MKGFEPFDGGRGPHRHLPSSETDVCLICSLNSAGLGTAMHTQAIWAAVHRPIGQAPRGKPQGGFGTAVEQIKGGRGGGGGGRGGEAVAGGVEAHGNFPSRR